MADPRRIVIYHGGACWDGAGAAWAISKHPSWAASQFVSAQYGDAPPNVDGAHVAIVDFSFSREILLSMKEAAETLVVLDHHETAEAALRGLSFCVFDKSKSGAALAWEFLHGSVEQMPLILRYIQDRDLWRFDLPASRLVNEYIRTRTCTPRNVGKLQHELVTEGVRAFAQRGQAVARRSELMVAEAVKHSRDLVIAGSRGRVANMPVSGLISQTGSELAAVHDSWGAAWFLSPEGVKVSMRSRSAAHNVSTIAQRFGGGGHPKAAGFTVPVATFLQALDSGRLDP